MDKNADLLCIKAVRRIEKNQSYELAVTVLIKNVSITSKSAPCASLQ